MKCLIKYIYLSDQNPNRLKDARANAVAVAVAVAVEADVNLEGRVPNARRDVVKVAGAKSVVQ